jgi:hypothetical protein
MSLGRPARSAGYVSLRLVSMREEARLLVPPTCALFRCGRGAGPSRQPIRTGSGYRHAPCGGPGGPGPRVA